MMVLGESKKKKEKQNQKNEAEKIPQILPILPLKDMVVFPSTVSALVIAGENSIKLIDDCLSENKMVGLFLERNPEREKGENPELSEIGTASVILKMLKFT